MKITKSLALCASLFFSVNVFAHALYISAQYDGTAVVGRAYYSDQTPAAETYVEVVKVGEGEPVVYGKTNTEGRFTLPLHQDGTFNVIIEGMEGHRAETLVTKNILQSHTISDIQILREEIEQLKNKLYFRDVIGGIGYIVGLFGFIALLKHKRKEK